MKTTMAPRAGVHSNRISVFLMNSLNWQAVRHNVSHNVRHNVRKKVHQATREYGVIVIDCKWLATAQ